MQRRHFELIAASVHRSRMASAITGTAKEKAAKESALRLVAIDLASTMRAENPRFDRDRFLTACGVSA